MDEFINKIARYKVFSTVDLKSAYHQITIHEDNKPYTSFEGNKRLYHFNRVSRFQGTIYQFIKKEEFSDTFVFLDDIHICGMDQEQHNKNLVKFRKASEKNNLLIMKTIVSFQRLN